MTAVLNRLLERIASADASGGYLALQGSDEVSNRLIAAVCANLVSSPSAFYDVAFARATTVLREVEQALTALGDLEQGANALLAWDPREAAADLDPRQRIRKLLAVIERARFARSEITETVRDDLVAAAQEASLDLASLQRSTGGSTTPDTSAIDTLMARLERLERFLDWLVTLRAELQLDSVASVFRQQALAVSGMFLAEAGSPRSTTSTAEMLEVTAAVEALLSLEPANPFGTLQILDATVTGDATSAEYDLVGYAVPVGAWGEGARVRFTLEGSRYRLETPDEPALVTQPLRAWPDAGLVQFGAIGDVVRVAASGTASLIGEANYARLVDTGDRFAGRWNSLAQLEVAYPAADHAGSWAVLRFGEVYAYSDGSTWEATTTGVDLLGRRKLLLSGVTPDSVGIEIGTSLTVSCADPAFEVTCTVVSLTSVGGTLGELFGVEVDTDLADVPAATLTWTRLDTSEESHVVWVDTAQWPLAMPTLCTGRMVWFRGENGTYGRRVIQAVPDGSSTRLTLVEALPLRREGVDLAYALLWQAGGDASDWPNSPYLRVESLQGALDLAPTDDLVSATAVSSVAYVAGASVVTSLDLFAQQVSVNPETRDAFGPETPYLDLMRVRALRNGDNVWAYRDASGNYLPTAQRWVVDEVAGSGVFLTPPSGVTGSVIEYSMAVLLPPRARLNVYRLPESPGHVDLVARAEALRGRGATLAFKVNNRPTTAVPLDSHTYLFPEISFQPTAYRVQVVVDVPRVRDSRSARLTVNNAAVADERESTAGSLQGSLVYDLATAQRAFFTSAEDPSGQDPPESPASVPYLYLETLRGPVVQGGAPEFGGWAALEWRVGRRTRLNVDDLREVIGRASADKGVARTYVGSGTLEVTASGTFLRDTGVPGARLLGTDLGGTSAVFRESPHVRVALVLEDDEVVLNRNTGLALGIYQVTVFDTAVAAAWRALRSARLVLEDYAEWLGWVRPPQRRFLPALEALARVQGKNRVAHWLQTGGLDALVSAYGSVDYGSEDRLESALAELAPSRPSPLEGIE